MTTSATAVLAGGCFWCTEAAFEQLEGVLDVTSGYAGGAADTANYRAVCDGDTGHAEGIRITYDPSKISFEQLLAVFFDAHDPTQLNRQGNDIGTQYRSAIFYADETQKQAAQAKIDQLNAAKAFSRPIATTLEPLVAFYPAEEYHQDYARLNPDQPYIQAVSMPKVCKVRDKHAGLITSKTSPKEVHRLIFEGRIEELSRLLQEHPGVVHARNGDNDAPIHSAAWAKQPLIVGLLCSHGADVNSHGCYGRTPLHYAVHEGGTISIGIVTILVTHGADPTLKDDNGFTPADWAKIEMDQGLPEVLKLLRDPYACGPPDRRRAQRDG